MSSPFSSTLPAFGSRKPAIRRRVVVLPQPEEPSSVTNSLSWISRFSPSRMRCPSNSTTISRSETTTELSILYVILLVLRYEKRQGTCPIFFAYKGQIRPAQQHDFARRTYPVTVYNKQSQSDCQSLCRCLLKLYKKLQKIYAAPWFRCSVSKQLFLRFQVVFGQQKRLYSACVHRVYRGIPFHLQIPPVRAAGVGQLHGGAVLAGNGCGEYRCIKTAGRKVGVR